MANDLPDVLFDNAANASAAFTQLSAILIGGVFILIGGALIYDWARWKFLATRVNATIKGLQKKGRTYHPVYSYIGPDGKEAEARSNAGSSAYRNKKPGDQEEIMIFPDRPFQARASNAFAEAVFGLILMVPGAFLLKYASTGFTVTPMTWVIAAVMTLGIGLKIKKGIKPKSEWDTKESFRARMDRKAEDTLKNTPLVTAEQIEQEIRTEAKASRWAAPLLLIIGLGMTGGGFYLGQKLEHLIAAGLRAPGEVVRLEYKHSSGDSSGSYHPVVRFTDQSGKDLTFRDDFGSNPASYSRGEAVTVLYDPQKSQDSAQIDRGLWNWALPGGLTGFGLLLLWGAVYNFRLLARTERR